MLTGLLKYFTNDPLEVEQNDVIDFLKIICQHIYSKKDYTVFCDILAGLDEDHFLEIKDYLFLNLEMPNYHLDDVFYVYKETLNLYTHHLATLIFSTIMDTDDFDAAYLSFNLYDYYQETKLKTVLAINRYVDDEFNIALERAFEDTQSDSGKYDEYFLENMVFSAGVLRFKNKGIGRRLKKLYRKNILIRGLFDVLGFEFKNGHFYFWNYMFIDGFDPSCYEQYVNDVYSGFYELKKQFNNNNKVNPLPAAVERNLEEINEYLHQGGSTTNNRLISEIIRAHAPVKDVMF